MKQSPKPIVIMGIDPGTCVTGFGIIEILGSSYKALDYGCIRPPAAHRLSDRYHIIARGLAEILEIYSPEAMAVEAQYVGVNVQSTLKLGMACGIALVTAKQKGVRVYQYSPTAIKKAAVGRGRASKAQVQAMVQLILNLPALPQPADAADALAIALCHAHTLSFHDIAAMEI